MDGRTTEKMDDFRCDFSRQECARSLRMKSKSKLTRDKMHVSMKDRFCFSPLYWLNAMRA